MVTAWWPMGTPSDVRRSNGGAADDDVRGTPPVGGCGIISVLPVLDSRLTCCCLI